MTPEMANAIHNSPSIITMMIDEFLNFGSTPTNYDLLYTG